MNVVKSRVKLELSRWPCTRRATKEAIRRDLGVGAGSASRATILLGD